MTKDKTHEFHFKIGKKAKSQLVAAAGSKGLSDLIAGILEQFCPFLEKDLQQGRPEPSLIPLPAIEAVGLAPPTKEIRRREPDGNWVESLQKSLKSGADSLLRRRYAYVSQDKKEERQSVHIHIPQTLYRRLKYLHHTRDFYSIAQLIRLAINCFLFVTYYKQKQNEWRDAVGVA